MTDSTRDLYKFPMRLRYAMQRAATVLTNCADTRVRELDEDSQAHLRSVLDELDSACAEAGLAVRAAHPDTERLDYIERHAVRGGTYKSITSLDVIVRSEDLKKGVRYAIDRMKERTTPNKENP